MTTLAAYDRVLRTKGRALLMTFQRTRLRRALWLLRRENARPHEPNPAAAQYERGNYSQDGARGVPPTRLESTEDHERRTPMTPAPSPEQVQHALKDVETGRATYKTADLLRSHIAELEQARDAFKAQVDAGVRIQAEVTRDATRMARERDAALATDAALREQVVHGHECRPPYPGGCRCILSRPHPSAALLDELETLRGQRALFDEAAQALYGYTEFVGPCAHGRSPWDRCDECGEGTSVAAAQKVIVKMEEEHRRDYLKAEKRADDAEAEVDRLAEERRKALTRAAGWKRGAKHERKERRWREKHSDALGNAIGDINGWVRFTYDQSWPYPGPASLLPRLKQLVADRELAALTEADQRILATAQPPDFLREHHTEQKEYEAAMSGYSVGVNHALDTIRRMIKVKKAIKPL